jgi:hypothetical protein
MVAPSEPDPDRSLGDLLEAKQKRHCRQEEIAVVFAPGSIDAIHASRDQTDGDPKTRLSAKAHNSLFWIGKDRDHEGSCAFMRSRLLYTRNSSKFFIFDCLGPIWQTSCRWLLLQLRQAHATAGPRNRPWLLTLDTQGKWRIMISIRNRFRAWDQLWRLSHMN